MNKRTIGFCFLILGFGACYFGRTGLLVALVAWIIGTMLFAKSFVK